MRAVRLALVPSLGLALALALAPRTRAQSKPDKPALKAPLAVFQNAQEGDWLVLRLVISRAGEADVERLWGWTTKSVAGDKVTLASGDVTEHDEPADEATFARGEAPDAALLVRGLVPPPGGEGSVADDERKLGDRAVKCRRLDYEPELGSKGKLAVKLWFASEASAPGLVALEVAGTLDGRKTAIA